MLGAGLSYAVDATGGEKSHTLTVSEMPIHAHSISMAFNFEKSSRPCAGANNSNGGTSSTNSSGGGAAHNNMPPYYALCYIIKL